VENFTWTASCNASGYDPLSASEHLEILPVSSSPSLPPSVPSGSGGGSGGGISSGSGGGGSGGSGSASATKNITLPYIQAPAVQCQSDEGCAGNESCSEGACRPLSGICGYAANHTWNYYSCCLNSDCSPGYACTNHTCTAVPQQIPPTAPAVPLPAAISKAAGILWQPIAAVLLVGIAVGVVSRLMGWPKKEKQVSVKKPKQKKPKRRQTRRSRKQKPAPRAPQSPAQESPVPQEPASG